MRVIKVYVIFLHICIFSCVCIFSACTCVSLYISIHTIPYSIVSQCLFALFDDGLHSYPIVFHAHLPYPQVYSRQVGLCNCHVFG